MTVTAPSFRSFADGAPGAPTAPEREDGPMTDISHAAEPVRERGRKGELWEFRALVGVTYPLFLTATIVRRAMGRAATRSGFRRRSVFAEAYATAAATLACAFMG